MAVMVEKQVEFGSALGGAEFRPIEHGCAEFDDSAVERIEFAFESELLARSVKGDAAKHLIEELFEQVGRKNGVRVQKLTKTDASPLLWLHAA